MLAISEGLRLENPNVLVTVISPGVVESEFADTISDMEAKLAEKEGSELDRAIERLDHFKSIQGQLNSTAMH